MAKVKLAANPTFRAKVGIPTPDGSLEIEFQFRHKTKQGLLTFQKEASDRDDIDVVMEIACGWNYDEESFSRDAVQTLLDERHAAAMEIVKGYMLALTQGRLGN